MKIKLNITRSINDEEKYQYEVVCTALEGDLDKIFCINTSDDSYAHVATLIDVNLYPESKEEAEQNSLPYYRVNSITVVFDRVRTAIEFEDYLIYRCRRLVYDVNRLNQTVFPSTWEVEIG